MRSNHSMVIQPRAAAPAARMVLKAAVAAKASAAPAEPALKPSQPTSSRPVPMAL